MGNLDDISIDRAELEKIIISFNGKINNYIKLLKQKSSEEILNGSILKAQKIINQLLPIENEFQKMDACHNSFLSVIRGTRFLDSGKTTINVSEKSNISNFDISNIDFTPNESYRIPILKSLIYLGGTAKPSDISNFIEKEMKNKFKPTDHEKGTNGFEKLWIEMVNREKGNMVKEGLIFEDKKTEQWEIIQNGINYLAQFTNWKIVKMTKIKLNR